MLYVFSGTDTQKAREKMRALVGSLQKKKPDALTVRVSGEEFDERSMAEYAGGQGLFEHKLIVVFDRVLARLESDALDGHLKDMQASPNIFILFEEMLTKPLQKKIEKCAEKWVAADLPAPPKYSEGARAFPVFSLTDALGRRDKKSLWVLYARARLHGIAAEELHGVLFWQVKAMLLARGARSAQEADLKPFVYTKSSRYARNFSPEELHTLSRSLTDIYHDARRGKHELDTALERFVLGV